MNIFVGQDAVHISTHGGGFARDGRLMHRMNKTALLPQLNAAIAFRGAEPVLRMMVWHLQNNETFDELVGDSLERKLAPIAWSGLFEAAIAGWSESRSAPEAYHIASVRKFSWKIRKTKVEGTFPAPYDADLGTRVARHGVNLTMSNPSGMLSASCKNSELCIRLAYSSPGRRWGHSAN